MKTHQRGIVSFPKAGRTWIRLFLEYYRRAGIRVPVIVFRHDDEFDYEKRLVLMRHPCDVMVSFHLHKWVRRRARAPVSKFIRVWLPEFNRRYATWSERQGDQLVVRYEDLFEPLAWPEILTFFDIPINEEALAGAIDKTRFKNIRRDLAEIKTFPSAWRYLAAEAGNYNLVEPENPEAHKFRRGVVGGYVDYLDEKDIDYILNNFTLGERWEPYRQQYLVESQGHRD